MKVLFIEARKKFEDGKLTIKGKLPKEIHILYTIQYKDLAEKIKKKLKKTHKILAFEQILGCSKIKPLAPILIIGSGKFHALSMALDTKKETYIYQDGSIKKLSREEILKLKKREKGKISKFFASENIGLIVSTKPGQNKLDEAISLKRKLKDRFEEKNFYIFISESIDVNELENFSLPIYINLACPGLDFDSKKIINYKNLPFI